MTQTDDKTTVTVTTPFDPDLEPIKPPPTPWNELSLGEKIAAAVISGVALLSVGYVFMYGRWKKLADWVRGNK